MGAGSVVASAISIVLVIVVAYMVIGSVILTAETVADAQEARLQEEELRLHTSIEITDCTLDEGASTLYLNLTNTGSEPVLTYEQMVVFTAANDASPIYYSYEPGGSDGTWSWLTITPDLVHPKELDPDEVMNISVRYASERPEWVQVTTPNGISDSRYLR
jgi:flagellar protein FlaF